MKNRLRIIGGDLRSRVVPFPDAAGLRPTPARVRETVFNWLQHDIHGARCLDLYAGSGALGFEAASRGAACVVQIERSAAVCRCLLQNSRQLGLGRMQVVQADVLHYLQKDGQPFDLVFLDPPFGRGMVAPTCRMLHERGWLAQAAQIYVEAESGWNGEEMPGEWRLLRRKTAGEVAYHLYQSMAAEATRAE